MHWLGWLMFGTALLWLAPGSLWRPIALALLVQWGVAEAWYQATGDHWPDAVYFVGDLAVIVCAIAWRSHWSDWIIVAPYPLVWWLYTQPETPAVWQTLYWVMLAQMILAGPWPQMQRSQHTYSHGALREAANEGA